jgi:hypothetical protein
MQWWLRCEIAKIAKIAKTDWGLADFCAAPLVQFTSA